MTIPCHEGDLYLTVDVHIPNSITPDHLDTGVRIASFPVAFLEDDDEWEISTVRDRLLGLLMSSSVAIMKQFDMRFPLLNSDSYSVVEPDHINKGVPHA